jgi:hypothetical protein
VEPEGSSLNLESPSTGSGLAGLGMSYWPERYRSKYWLNPQSMLSAQILV